MSKKLYTQKEGRKRFSAVARATTILYFHD